MKPTKILKLLIIIICTSTALLITLIIGILWFLWAISPKTYSSLPKPDPIAAAELRQSWTEQRVEGEIAEANKFAKLITIDEIPQSLDIKGIILIHCYDINQPEKTPDLDSVKALNIIGNPKEVGEIIKRNIPSNWVIGDSCDVKKITDDFRNASRYKNIPDKVSFSRSLFELFFYDYPSIGWGNYRFAKAYGVPVKDYYWIFPKGINPVKNWGWAIFVTESKGYALKYAIESRPNRIYGPDYYSRKLYKDLTSLDKKAKKK